MRRALALAVLVGCYPRFDPPSSPRPVDDLNTSFDDYNAAAPEQSVLYWATNRGTEGKRFEIWKADITWNSAGVHARDAAVHRSDSGHLVGPFPAVWEERFAAEKRPPPFLVYARDGGQGFDLVVEGEGPSLESCNTSANECYWTKVPGYEWGLFASDRNGRFDIFATHPVSPVTELCSPQDDTAPYAFLHGDRLHVVFASNRGGGYDLWCSVYEKSRWQAPRLLRYANSRADEFRPSVVTIDRHATLIFSSNRPGGKGGFDLYYAEFESPF